MGRNCSLKVQVLYTAPFSLTGVSLWSLSIHCPHGGVSSECVSERMSECAAMRLDVSLFELAVSLIHRADVKSGFQKAS